MLNRTINYVDKEGNTRKQTMSNNAIQNLAIAIKLNLKKCYGKFTATDIGLGGATMRSACLHGLAEAVHSIKRELILPYGRGIITVETKIYKLKYEPEKIIAELNSLIIDDLKQKDYLYQTRARYHELEMGYHRRKNSEYLEKASELKKALAILDN